MEFIVFGLILWLAGLTIQLLGDGEPILWATALSWVGGLTTAITFLASKRRLSVRTRRLAGNASVLVVLATVGMTTLVYFRLRELAVASVCAENLRYVGCAIAIFRNDHSRYADDIQELIKAGLSTPAEFHCPADRYAVGKSEKILDYSSYAYKAPPPRFTKNDSHVMAAFDTYDRHPIGLRLFPKYGRNVLWADTTVSRADDFAIAQQLDAQIRERAPD